MQLKIVRLVLATALAACVVPPVIADDVGAPTGNRLEMARQQSPTPYDAGVPAAARPESALLPDDRGEALRPLVLFGPAALIIALTALGLTITFRSLRQDIRQRRVTYRQRGREAREAAVR